MIFVPAGLRRRILKLRRLTQRRLEGAVTTPPGPNAGGSVAGGPVDGGGSLGGAAGGGPATPRGENTVRWENVAVAPGATLNSQLSPAPLSTCSVQAQVFGNGVFAPMADHTLPNAAS